MKKIVKGLFTLFVVLFGLNSVYADRKTCDDFKDLSSFYADNDFYKGHENADGIVEFHYKCDPDISSDCTQSYGWYNIYTIKDSKNLAYLSYCRNPNITNGKEADENKQTFLCLQTVFDVLDDGTGEERKAYDAGIVKILKEGYNLKKYSQTTAEIRKSKDLYTEYTATELALRVYEMLWGGGIDSNGKIEASGLNAHRKYANDFYDSHTTLINNLKNKGFPLRKFDSTDTVDPIKYLYILGNQETNITSTVENRAWVLVEAGLKSALDYANNGAAKLTWSNPVKENILTRKDEDGNKIYQKNVIYTFNAENFKNNAYIKMNFNCENCNTFGITTNIYINNKYVGNQFPTNLVDYLDNNGDGTLKVKIEFNTTSTTYSCGSVKYKIDVDWYDETINTEAFNISAVANGAGVQEFYMLYNYGTDVFYEKTIEDKFRLCELSCEELEKQCNVDKNADACEEFESKYDSTCIECGTKIQNAMCSENDADIYIKEGYEYDADTCTNSQSENILHCVINKEDEAGNSYEAQNIIKTNDYCTVWCKEDYHLTMPGIKEVNSGRYFSLKTSVKGTKTCYTSYIDYDLFEKDYKEANEEVQQAYNEYVNAITREKQEKANALNSKIQKLNNIFENYNSCSNWTMDYNFDPTIKFWYEESYMNNVRTDELSAIGTTKKESAIINKCASDTNDSYESCASGWSSASAYSKISLYTCYKNANNTYSCGNKQFDVSNTRRMKISINASGEYQTPTQFYNIYPTGAIAVAEEGANIENASPLNNSLPVGLGTRQGVYNYIIIAENLGEYYDSDKLGRVWGDNKSVVSETLKELQSNNKCTNNGSLSSKVDINGQIFDKGAYNCSYKVNCPDCPVECEPDGCYNPDCPENNCPVVCEDCIYNNGDSNIDYRPISPDSVNPNDRDLGKNWDHDDSISTALEMKAYVTTEEIEENGENIYDINYENTDSNADFAMEVTMDSKMISKIRAYNEQHEDDGGYLNNTLKCYDYEDNGTVYKNIFCYSTFLDDLLQDNDTKDNIKISGGTRYLTDAERKANWSGYWTTWSEANLNKWNITTEHGLAYYKENYASIGIGPAWK